MKLKVIIILFCFPFIAKGQDYKTMMADLSYNVYDVVEEAERYFATIDRNAKGSGWKGYQRWLSQVEPMYYPSGVRSSVNPRFAQNGFNNFLKKYPASDARSNSLGWQDLGPYNIDNISGHYSPGIGRIEHVYVDPNNANKIYLASRSGGFWRSSDGGASWENTTDFLISSGVDVFAVNPLDVDDILINVRNAGNGVTMGVYRSIDGGLTWNPTVFTPDLTGIGGFGTNERVLDIKFSPHNNDIFIAASGFLYRSTDDLATVQEVHDVSYNTIEFHQTKSNIIFAPRDYYWNRNEIWRSTDGGTNWSLFHDISDNNYRTFTVATTPADDQLVFFASGTHIWKSENDGVTIDTISGAAGQGNYFEVSDVNAQTLLSGGINIRMSYDGGTTWSTVTDWYWPGGGTPPSDYVHADLRYSSFLNGTIYCGTDGFMVKSIDNGTNWSIISNGTGIRENYRLGVSQSDLDITVCGSQDNGTSILQGKGNDWLEWIGADGMEGLIHPLDRDRMIGSIQYGNKRRSLDGGYSTSGINNHDSIGSLNWIAPVFYDPLDHMSLFTVGQTVHSSSDFGTSWKQLHKFDDGSFNNMVKSENADNIILACRSEKLYRSIDEGATFTQVGAAQLPNKSIQDISFDPMDDNNVIVVYAHHQDDGNRIFRSTDGGINWNNITYNLSEIPARSVAIDHTNDKNIYIGTEVGVFIMPWGDTQYELWSVDLPTVAIYELEIMYSTNTIRAATWGRGLWERCLEGRETYPQMTKVEINATISENSPKEDQNITLTAKLKDADDISSIFMKYSFNDLDLDMTLPLKRFNKDEYITDGFMPQGNPFDRLYFKVIAVNIAGDTTESYRYMYTLHDSGKYCSAEGSNDTGSDYVNLVSMNGVTKNSGKEGYADFTDVVFNLEKWNTYELEVGLAFHWEPDTVYAFIDWDDSKTFEEDEYYYFTMLNDQHKAYANISVPGDAVVGANIRMRVRNQYWNSGPDPCNTLTGEVEDYTIQVIEGCANGQTVMNLNDSGNGSLRYLIENTCPDDTIFISDFLTNDTLHIYNEEILIDENLVIIGLDNYGFTISGNNERRIFQIKPSATLSIHDLKFVDGSEDPDGGAIHNLGQLILTNIEFANNMEGIVPKALTNNGVITVKPGVSEVKE